MLHDLDDVLQHENFVADRSNDSSHRVSPSLIRLLQFGITSYNHGTVEEAVQEPLTSTDNHDNEDGVTLASSGFEENVRTQMIFQPILPSTTAEHHDAPRQHRNPTAEPCSDRDGPGDYCLQFSSSTLPKKRGLACICLPY